MYHRLKKISVLFLSVFILCGFQYNASFDKKYEWTHRSCRNQNETMNQVILTFLRPAIIKSLEKYYGKPVQSIDTIVYIKPYFLDTEIQVQSKTFTGPHNPPYGKDILTFNVSPDASIELMNLEHTDIPNLN